MTSERSSTSIPHYCPHKGCTWSFVGSKKHADGYLSVHMRVIHKGDDPRPATAAAADPDAELRALERRQAKAAKKARALGEAGTGVAPASPSADATPGEGNGAAPSSSPSPSAARARGRACKTVGCPNDANTTYDRGVYAGLCEQVCIPRRRQEISRAAIERRRAAAAEPTLAAAPPEQDEQAEATGPVEGSDEPLMSMIRQAARGRRELLEAEQRYLEQLRLLRLHPDYERVAPVIHDAVERL